MPQEGRAQPFGDHAVGDLWLALEGQKFGYSPWREDDLFATWDLQWIDGEYSVTDLDQYEPDIDEVQEYEIGQADVVQNDLAQDDTLKADDESGRLALLPIADRPGFYIVQISEGSDIEYFLAWNPRPREWVVFRDLVDSSARCDALSRRQKREFGISSQEPWECDLGTWPQVEASFLALLRKKPEPIGVMWIRE